MPARLIRPVRRARFAALALFVALLPTPALAYLEPGTGSLLLQALAGAIAVVLVTLRLYWDRTKALVRRTWRRLRARPTEGDAPRDGA